MVSDKPKQASIHSLCIHSYARSIASSKASFHSVGSSASSSIIRWPLFSIPKYNDKTHNHANGLIERLYNIGPTDRRLRRTWPADLVQHWNDAPWGVTEDSLASPPPTCYTLTPWTDSSKISLNPTCSPRATLKQCSVRRSLDGALGSVGSRTKLSLRCKFSDYVLRNNYMFRPDGALGSVGSRIQLSLRCKFSDYVLRNNYMFRPDGVLGSVGSRIQLSLRCKFSDYVLRNNYMFRPPWWPSSGCLGST